MFCSFFCHVSCLIKMNCLSIYGLKVNLVTKIYTTKHDQSDFHHGHATI